MPPNPVRTQHAGDPGSYGVRLQRIRGRHVQPVYGITEPEQPAGVLPRQVGARPIELRAGVHESRNLEPLLARERAERRHRGLGQDSGHGATDRNPEPSG